MLLTGTLELGGETRAVGMGEGLPEDEKVVRKGLRKVGRNWVPGRGRGLLTRAGEPMKVHQAPLAPPQSLMPQAREAPTLLTQQLQCHCLGTWRLI